MASLVGGKEVSMETYIIFIVGIICTVFGIVRTVWERKLIISRKVVTGTNGFSATVVGGLAGAAGLWQVTESYLYAGIYLLLTAAAYIMVCIFVKKKEYPAEERFTKEW